MLPVVRTLRWLPLTLSLLLAAGPASAEASTDYTLWYRNFDNPAILSLVELALEKTPEYGPFTISRSEQITQGRALRELSNNHSDVLDVANVATTPERESSLNTVPIPVDGGLLGFRVCLVLPENLPLFDGIRNLQDLRQKNIRIGQGAHWPDTPVLASSGIEVITNTSYELLFGMLKGGRFECFARGVNEVLYDLERQEALGLVIEPDLLLAYPMPSYLFTAPNDHETAQRLQLGLERAIRDGSFAGFLKQWYGRAVKELNLDERNMIVLQNPRLSEESRSIGRRVLENLDRRIRYHEKNDSAD
ncbi:MAG: ABC transporter substrate-binding protein [Alteromonadaceae bacterium]|nr:ABC transporter substrate-binding protein [Alteromonadaceae bacterium]